jgi:hypothetical protein
MTSTFRAHSKLQDGMGNWLDKARGRGDSTAQAEPFELVCECGTRLSGIRQGRAKRVICPQCGDAHFILPTNPYPESQRTFFSSDETQAPPETKDEPPIELAPQDTERDLDSDYGVADDSAASKEPSGELEVQFETSPESSTAPAPAPPPIGVPPPIPEDSNDVPPPLPSELALSEEIELDVPLGLNRRDTKPDSEPASSTGDSKPDSYDALFDGPLDVPLDIPLMDDKDEVVEPAQTPPIPSAEDIFDADLSIEIDADNNVGGQPRDSSAREVVVEDTDYKLVPNEPTPNQPSSSQPQPIDEDDPNDDSEDLVEEALDESPRKRPKKQRYDYEDIEVAEVVDESYLPDAKKMARGDDRLAEFDHLAEDDVAERDGERPQGEAKLKEEEAPSRISLSKVSKQHRKTRIKVFVVLGVLAIVTTSMTIWSVNTGNREQASIDLKEGIENGIAALEEGDFPLASRELRRAVDAQELLQIQTDRAKHIKHLLYETEAAASQLNESLFEIVDRADRSIKKNGIKAWNNEFDVNFAGRWVIFYGTIDDDNNVELPAIIGNAPIRIKGIDSLIQTASKSANPDAILFAGQLASCGKPIRRGKDGKPIEEDDNKASDKNIDDAKPENKEPKLEDDGQGNGFGGEGFGGNGLDADDDPAANGDADDPKEDDPKFAPQQVVENVWEIRFNPETAVLWTRTKSLEQLNFIGGDENDDLSKRVRQVVNKQNQAMGFPKDLGGSAESTTVAAQ